MSFLKRDVMFIVMRMLWFPQQFIGCEILGVCARVFCDFGEEFEVSDATGEEPKELFIQNITQVAKANLHTQTVSTNIQFTYMLGLGLRLFKKMLSVLLLRTQMQLYPPSIVIHGLLMYTSRM